MPPWAGPALCCARAAAAPAAPAPQAESESVTVSKESVASGRSHGGISESTMIWTTRSRSVPALVGHLEPLSEQRIMDPAGQPQADSEWSVCLPQPVTRTAHWHHGIQ